MSDVLPDYLAPGLRVVICGTAVGRASARHGGYYAGPGNEFWEYLHRSGLTNVRLDPTTDQRVLEFGIGLTDLVKSMSASSDRELSDFDVQGLARKIGKYRPTWLAFHGKTAAKKVARQSGLGGYIQLGPQPWRVAGRPVFVLPSASGANRDASRLEGKSSRLAWFRDLAVLLDADDPAVSDG